MKTSKKKFIDDEAKRMFNDACNLARAKADGKVHAVRVIRSYWRGITWHSAQIDGVRELGGKLGVGSQEVVFADSVNAK